MENNCCPPKINIFGQILDKTIIFLKCCNFFVFYCSVSCKKQDIRELIKKNDELSRQIYFIDFLILFWFADFLA